MKTNAQVSLQEASEASGAKNRKYRWDFAKKKKKGGAVLKVLKLGFLCGIKIINKRLQGKVK